MPVGLDCDTMLSALSPQCDGICRPPELGIVLGADAGEEHLERRHAERQAQRAVAVVRIEPVVAGLERHARRDEDGFVSGAADLEEDQALVLELDFLVVDPARQHHRAVRVEQILARQAVVAVPARSVCVLLPLLTAVPSCAGVLVSSRRYGSLSGNPAWPNTRL